MPLEVICPGFGRTGTLSLQTALNQLGYTTYHMFEAIKEKHLGQWTAKAKGADVDLDKLLAKYTATTDFPSCLYFKELLKHNPDAKVVLTMRDPERWFESANDSIIRGSRMFRSTMVLQYIPLLWNMWVELEGAWLVPAFGSELQSRNKQHCIDVYKRHVEEVRRVVPPEQLLLFEVKEGWEPLCKFLGKPVPPTPFPNVNDKAEFHAFLGRFIWTDRAVVAVLVALTAAAVAAATGWM